ncbi:hypothetical protein GLOIN_2v1763315 [Rhizophagus irregularis DAOM 181602=DAOM 197198]|nr:hypothetical protein GLOIN_2v1763315 [Rhizophagus irregularis DAOM 181602=DAOM 197198]
MSQHMCTEDEYEYRTEDENEDELVAENELMEFYLYMLEKWKRMEPALNLLAADNPNVRQRYLTDFDCINIDDTMVLLSPIERVIRFLSAFSYPTHGDIRKSWFNNKYCLSDPEDPNHQYWKVYASFFGYDLMDLQCYNVCIDSEKLNNHTWGNIIPLDFRSYNHG